MYQFPFLKEIENKLPIIPNGFFGNNMAGGNRLNSYLFDKDKGLFERFCG